jgi:hypothetical protein
MKYHGMHEIFQAYLFTYIGFGIKGQKATD